MHDMPGFLAGMILQKMIFMTVLALGMIRLCSAAVKSKNLYLIKLKMFFEEIHCAGALPG